MQFHWAVPEDILEGYQKGTLKTYYFSVRGKRNL